MLVKYFKFIVPISAILIVVVLVLAWWLQKPTEQVSNDMRMSQINVESTNIKDSADWLTYTNEGYGFSFQYPSHWKVEFQVNESDFMPRVVVYPNNLDQYQDNTPLYFILANTYSEDDFVYYESRGGVIDEKLMSGLRVKEINDNSDAKHNIRVIRFLDLPNGNWSAGNQIKYIVNKSDVELASLYDNVINSFIRLDIPDWQTYSSEELGFQVSFPKEYKIIVNEDMSYIKSEVDTGEFNFLLSNENNNSGLMFSFHKQGVVLGRGIYMPAISGYQVTDDGTYQINVDDKWVKVEPLDIIQSGLGDIIVVNGKFANKPDSSIAVGNFDKPQNMTGFYAITGGSFDDKLFKKILQTISSANDVKITGHLKYGDKIYYGVQTPALSYVAAYEDGREQIMATSSFPVDGYNNVEMFSDFSLSNGKSYLVVLEYGYEWTITYIFDLRNDKLVWKHDYTGIAFTKDDSFMYVCEQDDFAGYEIAYIYKVPTFLVVYNFELENRLRNGEWYAYNDRKCTYDEEKNTITLLLNQSQQHTINSDFPESREFTVNLNQLTSISYCNAPPLSTAMGRGIYPINITKYGDISFLGELFTASDCNTERISDLFGVSDGIYVLEPDIGLKNKPSAGLLQVLEKIGFEKGSSCYETSEEDCTHWTLRKHVPVEDILKLKYYSGEIKSSGCINCG